MNIDFFIRWYNVLEDEGRGSLCVGGGIGKIIVFWGIGGSWFLIFIIEVSRYINMLFKNIEINI